VTQGWAVGLRRAFALLRRLARRGSCAIPPRRRPHLAGSIETSDSCFLAMMVASSGANWAAVVACAVRHRALPSHPRTAHAPVLVAGMVGRPAGGPWIHPAHQWLQTRGSGDVQLALVGSRGGCAHACLGSGRARGHGVRAWGRVVGVCRVLFLCFGPTFGTGEARGQFPVHLADRGGHSLPTPFSTPNRTAAAAAAAEEEEVCMFQCSELHGIFKDALQKLEDLFGPELPAHVVSTVV